MIAGLGTDIARISRFKGKQSLTDRFMTDSEKEYTGKFRYPLPHIAGIWAAKEALVKALDKRDLDFKEVEVSHTETGRPFFICDDIPGKLHLSISHEKEYAVAVVVWEKNS
ncbi:MAG: holo-ACP synthase [bacterium]